MNCFLLKHISKEYDKNIIKQVLYQFNNYRNIFYLQYSTSNDANIYVPVTNVSMMTLWKWCQLPTNIHMKIIISKGKSIKIKKLLNYIYVVF